MSKSTQPKKHTPNPEWQRREAERKAREAAEQAEQNARIEEVVEAFEPEWLKWICEAHENHFEDTFDLTKVEVAQQAPHDFYYFQDNGADLLAVAHLDTVIDHHRRMCDFVETANGPMVWSGSLDDRLGAYTILRLMPALLGKDKFDILLTVGEESGMSTAVAFDPPEGRQYNWMIEFDRGGSDVVMYQYDDNATANLVRDCGAKVGRGSFSDIAYLEHLEVKGFNWGVAYRDYHGPKGHAWLDETFDMWARFLKFYEMYSEVYLPHEKKAYSARGRGSSSWGGGGWGSHYGNGHWWDEPKRVDDTGDQKVAEEFAEAIGVEIVRGREAEIWKENLVGKAEWPAGWPAPVKEKVNPSMHHKEGDGQEYLLTDGSKRTAMGRQVLWSRGAWSSKQEQDPTWSPANYMSKEEWLEETAPSKEVTVYGGDCPRCGFPVVEGICTERCDLDSDGSIFALFCENCGVRKVEGVCPHCCPDCGYMLGGVMCMELCGDADECKDCGFLRNGTECRERCGHIEDAVIDNPSASDLAYLQSLQRNERLLRVVD